MDAKLRPKALDLGSLNIFIYLETPARRSLKISDYVTPRIQIPDQQIGEGHRESLILHHYSFGN